MAHRWSTQLIDASTGQGPTKEDTMNKINAPLSRELGFGGLPEVFESIVDAVLSTYPKPTVVVELDWDEPFVAMNGFIIPVDEGLLGHLKNQRDVLSACLTVVPRTRRMYPKDSANKEDLEIQVKALRYYLDNGLINHWELILLKELGQRLGGHVNTDDAVQWNINSEEADEAIGRNKEAPGGSGWAEDIDQRRDAIAPTEKEKGARQEGRLKQLQVTEPTAADLWYDLYGQLKSKSWTKRNGEVVTNAYRDPKGTTKRALFAIMNRLEDEEPEVDGKMLAWSAGPGQVIAAQLADNPDAPATVVVPIKMVYAELASKDEEFGVSWELARRIQQGELVQLTAFRDTKRSRLGISKEAWRLKQRVLRMLAVMENDWDQLELDHGYMTCKIWGRMVDGWRELLGLPPRKIEKDQAKKVRPPKVKALDQAAG